VTCPVCAYPNLPYAPRDYHICPSCGTEFGNDDQDRSHDELRAEWIRGGALWFFGTQPEGWNGWMQLISGGYGREIPFHSTMGTARRPTSSTLRLDPDVVGLLA
jgi:hypothetical protein